MRDLMNNIVDISDKLDRDQDRRMELADAQKLVNACEEWTETKRVIEEDDLTAELITERIPYNKEQWKFFREEILKFMDGQHADYVKIGKMFVEEAVEYAESYVKGRG